ncbi:MAG: single-stranded DNA-binding protein [Eubacteriaceae bacterium]|nr:single-stranded DNA-binding protein [Eubacteriaceae bacterium]
MNKVILVGRLARDPELRTTGGGQSVCRFAVAVDRRFKRDGQPTADFINVVAFGKQAELINQYLGKGRRIALEGRIQTGSYTAQDGSKRYTTDVILDSFDFIDSRNDGGYGQGSGGNFQSANNAAPAGGQNGGMSMDDVDSDFHLMADDDDLPF